MGFFDSLFGGSSNKQNQTSKTTTNQDVESQAVSSKAGASSSQTGTVGAQTGTSATTQQQTQVNLSPEVQALVASLITTASAPGAGGGASADDAKAVAETLLARAGGTQDFVDERKTAILTAAERQGQKQVDAANTGNQRAAGSGFNTLVQQANQQAQGDLLTNLAGLEGQLDLAGREQETAALAQAFDALIQSGQLGAGAGLENLRVVSDLVSTLKGATSSTTGTAETATAATQESQSTENTIQQLLEMITQTQKGKTVSTSQGSAENNQGGSFNLIDLMPLLLE